MKNILVTGGCGFIASNFLNYMVKEYSEYSFFNLDAMYYCASEKNITVSSLKNYKFIKRNICSENLVNFILSEYCIDTVVHFAAQSHVDNSFSTPLQYTRDNILGTHTLLECCRKYNKIEKFIHVSTDEVYGESEVSSDAKMTEESLLCPTNPYSASKASAETIAKTYYLSYNFPIIITRGNNVYGPRQYPEKLIPKNIMLLNNDMKCTIHGKGDQIRSFLYIDDVVSAFEIILFKGQFGEIYNIGTDDEYTVMEVVKRIIKLIHGNDENVEDYITFVKDREFNDSRYYISHNKMSQLGWKQKIDFETGLQKTFEWYIDNSEDAENRFNSSDIDGDIQKLYCSLSPKHYTDE